MFLCLSSGAGALYIEQATTPAPDLQNTHTAPKAQLQSGSGSTPLITSCNAQLVISSYDDINFINEVFIHGFKFSSMVQRVFRIRICGFLELFLHLRRRFMRFILVEHPTWKCEDRLPPYDVLRRQPFQRAPVSMQTVCLSTARNKSFVFLFLCRFVC